MNRSLPRTWLAHAWAAGLMTLAGVGAAQAQQIGTYIGSTTEGDYVELTISDDGLGNPVFTGALSFWTGTCTKSGSRGSAWGVGFDLPVVNRKVTAESIGNALYEKWTLKFNTSGSRVTGTFLARTPEFVDVANNTKQVELCDTGTRNFSADLVLPSQRQTGPGPALRPGQAMPVSR